MKILIVGAGIGGLALAAFLNDSEIEYEIIEKCSDWSHQGYSISIWNNGRHILEKLGLAETFDKNSKKIQNYYIYNGKGRLLRSYKLLDFYERYGMALNLVNRKDIHDWLVQKLDASKIRMNLSIDGIIQKEDGAEVHFSNGETKKYDLVVGSDGIHSKVRSLVFDKYIESKATWRVWYMWIENKYRSEASVTEYIEPEEFISIFDSGDKTLAIICAPSNHVIWDDAKGRIERLKKTFTKMNTLVPQIFDNLKDEEIIPADLTHITLSKWFKDRVVLIGDAAHGFEPFGGIGGSMALEDGYVLAGELMKVSETNSLTSALSNYQKIRESRVKTAFMVTNKMKMWALIRSKILRRCVDLCVPYFPEKFFVRDYQKLLNEEI
jgi:2-polyprenyl-6-methoxyphenol hydroxylase-like FAD-dependent oxidoreductase